MDQKREHTERTTAVIVGEMRVIAVYQPVWNYSGAPVELYRREVVHQMTMCPRKTTLVKGGDHNSQFVHTQKAYLSVNEPALRGILQRYDLEGKFLETIKDIHETTAYHVREKDDENDRGVALGAGAPQSGTPVLFNVYLLAGMRIEGELEW